MDPGLALVAAGFSVAAQRPPAPRLDALSADLRAAVVTLYRELGGHQDQPVLRPGAWDLALAGGVVVELDEELHFNRYPRERWRSRGRKTSRGGTRT